MLGAEKCHDFKGIGAIGSAALCLHSNGLQKIKGALLLGARCGEDLEGGGLRAGAADPTQVAGDAAQELQKRLKAVHLGAILQGPGVHLTERFLGTTGRRHRVARLLGFEILVGEQQRAPRLQQVPEDVVGEQTHENVGPDPVSQAVVDGSDLEVHRFEGAEGPLHAAQEFVAEDRLGGVERLFRQAGAHHVETVEGRFGLDLLRVDLEVESIFLDVQLEVLADFVLVEHLAHPNSDVLLAVEATPLDPLAQVLQLLVDRLAMTGVTLASSLRHLRALGCRLGQLGSERLFLDSILETVLPNLQPIVLAQSVVAEPPGARACRWAPAPADALP